MLVKPKTTGPGKVVRFKRRQVRRNPRRPLEAVQQDFNRWDTAAALLGLNWSEFARRAMNQAAWLTEKPGQRVALAVPELSEKPGPDEHRRTRAKATGTRAVRKG